MKIVFLQDDFPPYSFGGAGISTYEFASRMKEKGHDVYVITTCREKKDSGKKEYNGLTVFHIQSNYYAPLRSFVSLYNWQTIPTIKKILKTLSPDVVHVKNVHFYLSYYAIRIAKKYARRVVFTARDTMSVSYGKLQTKRYLETRNPVLYWYDNLLHARKRWNPVRNLFIRWCLSCVDFRSAISVSVKHALEVNGISDVSVIYNGIVAKDWHIEQSRIDAFKSTYQLKNKHILFFNGRLSAPKGGACAIDALAHIVKKVPDTILLVAGSIDTYAEAMRTYAKTCGVEGNIIFTGWLNRDEIMVAYFVSDIVLMLSLYLDAFGRVNIEAMASGKPVIGTCFGGTPEIVVNDVTGYIVNPLYPIEVAEKAIDLFLDKEKREAFGVAGRMRVEKYFSLDDKIEEYIRLYQ